MSPPCETGAMTTRDFSMRILVARELRHAFVRACKAQDRPASDVLHEFMRQFTDQQTGGQTELFAWDRREAA